MKIDAGRNIRLKGDDVKVLEEAKAAYAASNNFEGLSWGDYIMHLFKTNGTVTDTGKATLEDNVNAKSDIIKITTSLPFVAEQYVPLAQPVVAIDEPSDTQVKAKSKGMNEEEDVCIECNKKQAEIRTLSERLMDMETELAEKTDSIPGDLNTVIAHCEDGSCSGHAAQWEAIKREIVEANKPDIIAATLRNLPDAVIEYEGLKRGFIPKTIIVPIKTR